MKNAIFAAAIAVSQFSMDEIKTCFQRELDRCGDVICEMSTDDNAKIIEQVQDNVIDCLEQKRK